jgi:hypothetical protein
VIPWYHDTTVAWYQPRRHGAIYALTSGFSSLYRYYTKHFKRLSKLTLYRQKSLLTCVFFSVYFDYCKASYFVQVLIVSRRCRLKNPPLRRCVVTVPLRPRRNPNRIGYQAVAAGEKRTAGNRGIKNASEKPKAPNLSICCLNSKAIHTILWKEFLNYEFATAN